MSTIFLNDSLVEADQARIDPADAGLLHGIGLFETVRVYARTPFRLKAHLDRLFASAARLELDVGYSAGQIVEAVDSVIQANSLTDARLRITVTRGPVPATPDDAAKVHSTLLVTATGQFGYPSQLYEQGMAVAVAGPRVNPTDPTAGHKTLNYWPRLMTLRAAQGAGFGEALWFTTAGVLASGCVSNVFLAKDGVLFTPPVETPVLPGIARATVIELAGGDGIEVRQDAVTHEQLLAADEVFLTNSIMEVMPVVLIERHGVGAPADTAVARPKVGPLTAACAQLYRSAVQKECGT